MLFKIPDCMPLEHYAIGSLNLILFIAFTIILFIFGVLFLLRAKKQEVEMAKRIKFTFGIFAICYGICRFFFILMFHIDPVNYYDILSSIAYSSGNIGFTTLIWALEKAKYKTKYFFLIGLVITCITIIGTIIQIVFKIMVIELTDVRLVLLQIITYGMPIAGFFIIILYISLIRLSTGIVRKKALYSLIGFVILIVGMFMDGQMFLCIHVGLETGAAEAYNFFTMNIVPLICIGGYLLFAIPQL